MQKTKIAFLYSEVAGYFLACAKELAKNDDVLIVRWPVNKEAPFLLDEEANYQMVDKSDYSLPQLSKLLKDFNPDILVCSGWMDKDYLKVAKGFNKKIPIVLTLDNHWTGSAKQRLLCLLSNFYLKRIFTHAWVPGDVQKQYAEKLGFKGKVVKNFYCADAPLFQEIYKRTFENKQNNVPKRFLYVARYVEHKGIFEMWEAFVQLQKENPSEWELLCLGTGDEWDSRVEHEKIKHIGFVQPTELEKYIAESSVYILPSKFEPWGVTVQEFAICGLPLLLSDAIGANEKYLKENGIEFKSGSVEEIKKAMKAIMQMTDEDLIEMGRKSHELGVSFTPTDWANNARSFKL